ncbi:hypothetical protein N665_1431s0006 [Sinapis alba]|nr:hypothetical protein N665_1431s0006 [Sinapis alba]
MMRQLPVVYGEWLVKDHSWDFVVDYVKRVRMFFLTEGSTYDELVQMTQEDYNLDMNIEVVELTYSLIEAMMQHMALDTPPIHVTSDRHVQNLIVITKTHYVLCVSSRGKFRNKEVEDNYEVSEEVKIEDNNEGEEYEKREEYEEGEEYDDNLSQDGKYGREKDGKYGREKMLISLILMKTLTFLKITVCMEKLKMWMR